MTFQLLIVLAALIWLASLAALALAYIIWKHCRGNNKTSPSSSP